MRKQYHFRPGEKGWDVWDVDRLIELSRDLPIRSVSLEDLSELEENYWYQGPDEVPTCRSVVAHMRLVLEADLSYPIILCSEGRIMDGMHRVGKALLEGRESIGAVRFATTPDPDKRAVGDPDALPYE